jgi:protein-disulfide isomerase
MIVLPFALAGGSWIFLAVVVALFFAFVYSYYTRRGSGISQTPYRNPSGPPESPSELAHDTTQEVRNWERGTAGHHRLHQTAGRVPTDPAVAQALADWRARLNAVPHLDPPIAMADRARGPEEAQTVVIYIDISNEPCRSAYRLLSGFADSRRIRLAVRQLPLADVHVLALPAAEALEAAAAQGKFFELLDDYAASAPSDENELLRRAERHVPDPGRLRDEVHAGRYRASVVEQIRQAVASGVPAVPDVYIDGTRYGGPVRTDEFTRALRSA